MNNRIHNYNDIPDEIELEDEFKNIFNKMEYSNQNIFITGKAGTGKMFRTYINYIIADNRDE